MTRDKSRDALSAAVSDLNAHSISRTTSPQSVGYLDATNVMELEGSRVSEVSMSLPPGPSGAPMTLSGGGLRLASQGSLSALPSQPTTRHQSPTISKNVSAADWDTHRAKTGKLAPATGHLGSGLPSLTQTPQHVGMLSLQSSVNVLTPPRSSSHTPRAASGAGFMGSHVHGLARFISIPATPAGDTAPVKGFAMERPDGSSDEGTPPASATTARHVELPMRDERRPNYGGTTGKTETNGESVDGQGGDGEGESDDSRNRSGIEFNSFAAMDSSFINNASSHGSPGGAGPQYNTLRKAIFHVFKGNVGAGVFLLPTYYQDSGYVLGIICVALLGMLMVDCALALLHAKHAIKRAEVKTYPAVVNFVLGSWFRYFTDFALIFTQFGFCVMYIQYAASIFASLVEFPHAYAVWIVVTVVTVTPMTFISNKMNLLAYASMLAGLFVVVVLAGTTVVDVQHLASTGVAAGVVAFLPSARILVFLSGHMFSLEGIGVVLPIENSLAPAQRGQFGTLVKYTLTAIVSLYIAFGVLGYCAYGDDLHTSVVLALPSGFMKKALQCLLGLSLIFGFPIQYVPAIQLVDRAIGVNLRQDRNKGFLVRVVLNVLFGVFALFIGGDALNIFASFLGSFAGVHLMITIPSLLALQIDNALDPNREHWTYAQYMGKMFWGPVTWHRVRRFMYLALALVVWIGGLYFTFDSVLGETPSTDTDHTTPASSSDTSSSRLA